MKKLSVFLILLIAAMIVVMSVEHKAAASAASANQPTYTADGKLVLPANYRDWTFLTSGFGMNYSQGVSAHPMFTNVFVSPEAYQGFKSTGKWPDKSMFIVEIYSPATHGSINKGGHYQDAFHGLDVEVKDSSREQEWSYYNFAPGETNGDAENMGCNSCHSKNAAVEHTFVQFYPTLLDFAVEKNLVKPGVSIPLNQTRLLKLMETSGWEKAEQAYNEDRKKNPDSDLLDEAALNGMGYTLLQQKKIPTAISIFELAAKNYPNSANAYDSLADGYAAAAQPQLAIVASQKEMALAPNDPNLKPEQKQKLLDLAKKRIAENQNH
ncbi:MAG TPA: cytochrome P460 family protein [Candidatus Angelobacter sp.]